MHAECLTNARKMVMKVYYCCVRVWDEGFHPLRSRLVARTSPKMPAPLFMVETDLYRVAGSSKTRNKGCLRSVIKPPNRGLRIGGNVVRAARLCIPLFFGAAAHDRCNRRSAPLDSGTERKFISVFHITKFASPTWQKGSALE